MGDDADGLVEGIIDEFLRGTLPAELDLVALVHFLADDGDAVIDKHLAASDKLVGAAARGNTLVREVFVDTHRVLARGLWSLLKHRGTILYMTKSGIMPGMKGIIQFQVSESDGGYVAEGVGVPIVTQGDTFDELTANIREAVELYTEDENLSELGFVQSPSVLVNFELPTLAHA